MPPERSNIFLSGENTGTDAAMRQLAALFSKKKLATPSLDARILTLAATGISLEKMICNPGHPLSGRQRNILEDFAARRLRHEPVSRIIGKREFMGRDFTITPHVLDPRPDSEILVETALTCLPERPAAILDLGTGSGCLLVSILAQAPQTRGIGIDTSEKALECARANAISHAVHKRAGFICGNWYSSVRCKFDLIISNPPYISQADIPALAADVRDYDPRRALDGGADGLNAYREILGNIAQVIKPGGWLVMEFGLAQSDALVVMMKGAGFEKTEVIKDMSGHFRVLKGKFVKN